MEYKLFLLFIVLNIIAIEISDKWFDRDLVLHTVRICALMVPLSMPKSQWVPMRSMPDNVRFIITILIKIRKYYSILCHKSKFFAASQKTNMYVILQQNPLGSQIRLKTRMHTLDRSNSTKVLRCFPIIWQAYKNLTFLQFKSVIYKELQFWLIATKIFFKPSLFCVKF